MRKTVLLLRSPELNDQYHDHFEKVGILALSIPILDFNYCNQEDVLNCVNSLNEYSGLVFTSKQAVKAFEQALHTANHSSLVELVNPADFSVFVVGRATANSARMLGINPVGENCGNAESLAYDILKSKEVMNKPVLFMCGKLALETLPSILSENGVNVVSVCCYETVKRKMFAHDLMKLLESHGHPDAIVFFSPSGAQFYVEELQTSKLDFLNTVLYGAIGMTTMEGATRLGLRIDILSPQPAPAALVSAVVKAMGEVPES